MSLKINLKVAALLCDEVRHNRPKFDICRKVCFWGKMAHARMIDRLYRSIIVPEATDGSFISDAYRQSFADESILWLSPRRQ